MVLGDSGDPHRNENHCSRTISEIIVIHMNLRLGTWISVVTILAPCVHQDFLISHIEGKTTDTASIAGLLLYGLD